MMWLIALAATILLLAGTALAYVIGASAVMAFFLADQTRQLAVLPQKIFSQIDVFALMAMPLFILVGEIMNRGGVTKALLDLSMTIVGRLRGGLGHVNIMTSVFFAGISGSAIADAAALSNTLVPEMRKHGYSDTYASAITAASAVIGPIVPPSIILIFYGAVMQTSVTALFMAGILPGLLLAVALFATNAIAARLGDHPRLSRDQVKPFGQAVMHSLPATILPVIIVGGIVFGLMTPTEAASVAVVVALLAGWFYGGLDRYEILQAFQRTAMLSGSIFMILSAVAVVGHIASLLQVPAAIADLVTNLGLGPIWYLLALNVLFLIVGMILDIPIALALLVPLLAPLAIEQGADPVHLGIVICFNLCIGLVSPPLGGCLLVVAAVTGTNYWRLARAILPFVAVEIAVLGILIFIPEITLAIPRMMGLVGE
jgi:tripartite ATP-independent transporter DctM subunit